MATIVVGAVTFHDPARPALDIVATLEEIEINRDIPYKGKAVYTCLKPVRRKGFEFK